MTTIMLKHESRLAHVSSEYDDLNNEWVELFDNLDAEGTTGVQMSTENWTLMGNPEIVTVTVEPGDKLNES